MWIQWFRNVKYWQSMIRTHNLVHSPFLFFSFLGPQSYFGRFWCKLWRQFFRQFLWQFVAVILWMIFWYLSKLHILTHQTLNRSTFDLALYHNIRIMYWNTRVSINFEMSFWCHCFDQKTNKNIVRISALKVFKASLGLPGSFLGLPGDLVSSIINKEAYRKPQKPSRKPQGSFKNLQGRNPYNIFVAILEN